MTEDEMESPETEIVPKNELQVLVNNSGLEVNKANFMLEQFSEHYRMAAEWAKKAKKIIVTDDSQTVNMKMARTGRLFLREKRIEIESARKQLKESALKEGKAIDMIANFLKDLIIPTEEHLDRQEHFLEYRKKAEDERILAEAHAKQEEERIAKEKADAEEMIRLREKQAQHDKEMAEERRKANEARLKADKEQNEAFDRLRKETEIQMAKERAEREKVESELRAKRQAEAMAEADRIKKEEQLKNAGDCEKLMAFRESIKSIKFPEVSSHQSKFIIGEVKGYFNMALGKLIINVQEEE